MPPVGKKLNHFVSRFYLGARADSEYVFCLMRSKVFRPNLMGVASENYFYRLQELTDEDLALIDRFIDESPEPARETGLHSSRFEAVRCISGASYPQTSTRSNDTRSTG